MPKKLNLLILLIGLIGLTSCSSNDQQSPFFSATPAITPLSPKSSPKLFSEISVTATPSPAPNSHVLSLSTVEAKAAAGCAPTLGDEPSPIYRPDAPVRASVGHGHILRGLVRSSLDCSTIAGARIELVPEDPGGGHSERYRATVFTDSTGNYYFECNQTDHIHMRISAAGYRTIFSNHYHPRPGQSEGRFDIVLVPGS